MNDADQKTAAQTTTGKIDLESTDLVDQRLALSVMITALKNGPKSRERSIVITKLEEARLWAGEAMMTDPAPIDPPLGG